MIFSHSGTVPSARIVIADPALTAARTTCSSGLDNASRYAISQRSSAASPGVRNRHSS